MSLKSYGPGRFGKMGARDLLRGLPYKARLKYLESSGTQYIDTGIVPTTNTSVEFSFSLSSVPSHTYACAFGVFGDSSENYIQYSGFTLFMNPTVKVQARTGRNTNPNMVSTMDVAANTQYTGTLRYGVLTLNETDYSATGLTWVDMTRSILLFTAWRYNSSEMSNSFVNARFSRFKAYESGNLVQSLIPVLDNSDISCMYDEVTDAFFYNQGTGSFIAGPVIS